MVARRAHNPKVAGSNPAPATTQKARKLTVSGPFSSEAVLQKGRACTKDVPAQGVPCVSADFSWGRRAFSREAARLVDDLKSG